MIVNRDENGNYMIPSIAGKKVFFFTGEKIDPIRDGVAISMSYEEVVENDIIKHYFYVKVAGYPNDKEPRNIELRHLEMSEAELKTTLKLGVEALKSVPV